jgi:hypothetical protein
MAHTCPDCGQHCHCGGDIDDCSFDNTPEQDACMHCDPFDDEDGEMDDEPAPAPQRPGGET